MPKLNKKMAAAVAKLDPNDAGGDFPLLDPGFYYVRLGSVDVAEGNFAPRWSVELDRVVDEDMERRPGRLWYNINVPEAGPAPANYVKGEEKWAQFVNMSQLNLAAFFNAFGYETSSDTDEMIGEWAKAKVVIETIQSGNRKGEQTNRIKTLMPVEEDFDPSAVEDGAESTF